MARSKAKTAARPGTIARSGCGERRHRSPGSMTQARRTRMNRKLLAGATMLASLAFAPLAYADIVIGLIAPDRKSVVSGKRVSVRVDLGGRRNIKKKKKTHQT